MTSSCGVTGKHCDALPSDVQLLGPLTTQPHLSVVGLRPYDELRSAGVAKCDALLAVRFWECKAPQVMFSCGLVLGKHIWATRPCDR